MPAVAAGWSQRSGPAALPVKSSGGQAEKTCAKLTPLQSSLLGWLATCEELKKGSDRRQSSCGADGAANRDGAPSSGKHGRAKAKK